MSGNVVTAHKHQWEMEWSRREAERADPEAIATKLARGKAIVAGLKALVAKNDGTGPGLSEEQYAWLTDAINGDLRATPDA
jgi:hypothetical protein